MTFQLWVTFTWIVKIAVFIGAVVMFFYMLFWLYNFFKALLTRGGE